MRYLLTAIFSTSLFLVGCSSNSTASKNNQNGNLSVSCSAVAGTVSGSTVPLSISAFGGLSPYVVTGISIAGSAVTSVSGSTTFSSSTQLSAIFSGVSLANAVGTVTIMDASSPSSSASCSFMTGGGVNPNPTNKCTVVASNPAPAVNQDVTLTFNSASGFGVGPYTFSNLQAGSNVTVVSPLQTVSSNQAVATVRYSAGGSQTISGTITDITGQSGSCSTSVTVSGGGTSGATCSMAGTVNGMNISWQVSSPSGSPSINSFSPGDQGSYSYISNPIVATYSAAGVKNAVALAYVNGQPCNGNGYVYGSATVNQASNMTCQLIINPNPSRAGYWVSVSVIVQGGISPSLREITFPTGYGIGGQYTGPLTAQMVFVYPGQFPVYAKVADVYGTQATCQTLQSVSY